MGVLGGWQDSYYMLYSTAMTVTTDEDNFTGGSCLGPYGSAAPQFFPTNHPVFDLNKGIISARKATGRAYLMNDGTTDIERTPGTIAPTTTTEFDLEAEIAFIPFLTLMQVSGDTVTTLGDTTDVKVFEAYTGSTVGLYASLLRKTESGQSHEIFGAIANSITISGEEGDAIKCSVEWQGANMVTGVTTTSITSWDTGESRNYLLFQDLVFRYDGSTTADIVGFEVTLTNNTVAQHYNNLEIKKFLLGNFEVSGTFRVPWSSTSGGQNTFINRLISGTDMQLEFYWGHSMPEDAGDFAIKLNVEIDTATTSGGEDEAITEVAFTGIWDATNPIAQILMYDGLARNTIR